MTMQLETYSLYLIETNAEVYNENYKTDKLKDKLKKQFGKKRQFLRPLSEGELVYSDDIQKGQAAEAAFESVYSDERRVEETAMILRRHILNAKRNSFDMPFPPTASWLSSQEREPLALLQQFLLLLVSGNSKDKVSAKSLRFVNSCSQDIFYATTNGQWKMPKHILLAMTVHHLTESAQVITMLNRFDHCKSYSRTLELKTAMCNSVTARSSFLPANISTEHNELIYFCWDNLDLNEETPSGAETTHIAHEIVIQEVENGADFTDTELPNVPKLHEHTSHLIINYIDPCFAKAKAEPDLNVTKATAETCDFGYAKLSDFLWIFTRKELSRVNHSVPS